MIRTSPVERAFTGFAWQPLLPHERIRLGVADQLDQPARSELMNVASLVRFDDLPAVD